MQECFIKIVSPSTMAQICKSDDPSTPIEICVYQTANVPYPGEDLDEVEAWLALHHVVCPLCLLRCTVSNCFIFFGSVVLWKLNLCALNAGKDLYLLLSGP